MGRVGRIQGNAGSVLDRGLDAQTVLAGLRGRDLSHWIRKGRVCLSGLAAPAASVRALEKHLNVVIDANAGMSAEQGLPFALANVVAFLAETPKNSTWAQQVATARREVTQALNVFLERLHLDTVRAQPSQQESDTLTVDLVFGDRTFPDGGAVTRWLLGQHRDVAAKMPLLAATQKRFGKKTRFDRVALLAVQHLLESTFGLFDTLGAMGLSPQQSTLVGKRYSTDGTSSIRASRSGYNVHNLAFSEGLPGAGQWAPNRSADREEAQSKLGELLHAAIDKLGIGTSSDQATQKPLPTLNPEVETKAPPDTLLMLDDGAEALVMAAELPPPDGRRFIGVEQTRFGAWRIAADPDFPFGVVDVADSPVKVYMESVLIGWSVASEIERTIAALETQGVSRGKEVTLLGYGAVGRATALALADFGYRVTVLDPDSTQTDLARADGFAVARNRKAALANADYLVGATGKTALLADEYNLLQSGVVLFSASSSTVEFAVGDVEGIELKTADTKEVLSAGDVKAQFGGQEISLGLAANPDHWHRVVGVDDKELLLANSGYPINFTGGRDPLSPEMIQLTRSLLLLGCIQAADLPPEARGLVPLDAAGQRFIARQWMYQMRQQRPLPDALMHLLEQGYERVLEELPEPG